VVVCARVDAGTSTRGTPTINIAVADNNADFNLLKTFTFKPMYCLHA
jgi:hypothetical protein